MCNACGNVCCGSDEFGGCGCDGCDEPDCWSTCDQCGDALQFCCCTDDDIGPDDIHPAHQRPEFLG